MEKRRYLLIVVGSANGIQEDITNFADENGAYFVDGKGMFLSTFYSEFTTEGIFEFLMDRPACMVFDITEDSSYAVNLPKKYYLALFPEVNDILEKLDTEIISQKPKNKVKSSEKRAPKIEEYDDVNLILDKLSRNDYDRECLTKKELEILDK